MEARISVEINGFDLEDCTIKTDLVFLPAIGSIYHLLPKERKKLTKILLKESDIKEIVSENSFGKDLKDSVENAVVDATYVNYIVFDYTKKSHRRFVHIYLADDTSKIKTN